MTNQPPSKHTPPPPAKHEAGKHEQHRDHPPDTRPPVAAAPGKPHDNASPQRHVDPQEAKLELAKRDQHLDPQDHKPKGPPLAFVPEPALDPRAEKIPVGAYVDGMTIADEQRARAAWIEAHGMKAYHEAVDERTDEEKAKKQVPGVTPPTKRE
jgi:hypothetical protein